MLNIDEIEKKSYPNIEVYTFLFLNMESLFKPLNFLLSIS